LISDLENLDATIAVASLSSSNAEVSVCMKPEETLLIAGLLKNKKSKKVSRFPILGFIPIIEILFKSVKEEISERELLMFITPRIVSARQSPKEVINTDTDRQNKEYNKLIIKE
jgi:type II secretory pathway component GspD/PulD (secretin)